MDRFLKSATPSIFVTKKFELGSHIYEKYFFIMRSLFVRNVLKNTNLKIERIEKPTLRFLYKQQYASRQLIICLSKKQLASLFFMERYISFVV